MTQATIFKNNTSQAVRLPKDVALPDGVKTVEVMKIGRARLITPTGSVWDDFFDNVTVSDDFMTNRDQPSDQEREPF